MSKIAQSLRQIFFRVLAFWAPLGLALFDFYLAARDRSWGSLLFGLVMAAVAFVGWAAPRGLARK